MLTFDDCLRVCPLTEDDINAIAEHEHMPCMVALELANYLVQTPDGCRRIRAMILDDIVAAERTGNVAHALALKATLRHFVETHPENPTRRVGLPNGAPDIVSGGPVATAKLAAAGTRKAKGTDAHLRRLP